MKITRLRLRDVRRHHDLLVEPAPGLTVIRGPNEAGKTTIQRAVELALYRRVTSADGEMRDIQRWGSREQDAPIVELDFESNGTTGRLHKAFRGAKGSVELVIDGERTSDPATVDARLAELTGVPNEKFFRSTASVRHHEVMELDRDEANLRDRLQQSISGAGRGVSIARRRLDDAVKAMKAAGPKNPGPLKRTEDDRARLSELLQRGEEALARLERDREAHVKAAARREAADTAHSQTREQLQQAELAVKLAAEKAEAERRYEQLRNAADLRAQVTALEDSHPSAIPLDELRRRVEELRTVEATIAQCKAVLEAEETILDQPLPEPRWRRLFWTGNLLVYAGLVIIAAQAWARLFSLAPAVGGSSLVTLLGSLLAVAGALSVLVAYRRRASIGTVLGSSQLRHAAIERRLRGRTDTEQRLRDAERRRESLLGGIAKESLAEGEQLLSAEDEHVRQIQLLQARYAEQMRGESVVDPAAARDEAAAEAERKGAALLGMGELGQDPRGSRDRIEARLRNEQLEREAAMREEAATGERVEQNQVDALEVAGAAEALAQVTERSAALQRRLRVYETTLSALESAEAATMKKATAFLEQRMAADVGQVTGGRYDRVQVLDELQINLWSPERGDWVPVASLSQGTIDQVYLAARIELVRLVTQDRRPPLIFDDPFVTYDDDRAARALEMLRGLAADHQIIYLTTSARYDGVADKVITLPAPDGQPKKR
jgi:DNA repair exonuclease SbcCD ATPase subunit